jgi:hypothetical protein
MTELRLCFCKKFVIVILEIFVFFGGQFFKELLAPLIWKNQGLLDTEITDFSSLFLAFLSKQLYRLPSKSTPVSRIQASVLKC